MLHFKNAQRSPAPVARACNPSYSGGRYQEDCSLQFLKRQIVPQDPILEKAHHKKGLVEWLKVKTLTSNPSTTK
jgi:hypothetical protein